MDEADSAFIKAQRINPKNVRAKMARGAVAYLRGHYKDAKKAFNQALTLDPQNSSARTGLLSIARIKG